MKVRSSAFTLIELLVVIAIISILAAILFPAFASAKAAAKGIVCISTLKQMGLAIVMYVDDHDELYFPAAEYDPLPGYAPQKPWIGYDNNNGPLVGGFYGSVINAPQNQIHPGSIDPYLKSPDLKRCPNMPAEWQTSYAVNGFRTGFASPYYTSNPAALDSEYGPFTHDVQLVSGVASFHAANDSAVQESAKTLLIWEHKATAPLCNFLQGYDWYLSPPDIPVLKDHFNFLHNGGTNTLWADSHAKRMVYGSLKRPYFSVRKDIYP